jgi:hypothetical protein
MKKTILVPFLFPILLGFTACGGGKSDKATEDTKTDTTEAKTENQEAKEETRKIAEPTELGSYETKCDEQIAVSKLIFDGQEIDTKNVTKSYAFNFGGTTQLVYLANFEPDMKMLESGNIKADKIQSGQVLIKLQFMRTNNKTKKDLITTVSVYDRIFTPNPESESENKVFAYVFTNGKAYGNAFLGRGIISAVTTKVACGKVDMKGENDDKYQLACTFSANNQLK